MLALATAGLALVATHQAPSPLMKLRGGGLPSVNDASKYLGYVMLASGTHTFAYPKENTDLYKPSKPLDQSALSFARMNGAMQIAMSQLLLGGDVMSALALGIYGFSAAEADNMKMPKAPLMAWVAFILGSRWAVDAGKMPDWVFPAALAANGAYGMVDLDGLLKLYDAKTPFSKMGKMMCELVCASNVAIGAHMLLGVMGKEPAEQLAALTGIFGLACLKMTHLDNAGDFDAAGGYAWSAMLLAVAGIGVKAIM